MFFTIYSIRNSSIFKRIFNRISKNRHFHFDDKVPFSSYKLAIICSPKHELALKEPIEIDKLMQERLLLKEKGSAIRDVFDSALLLHNLRANPEWTSINSQALIYAVKQNLGISVLPKILVEKEIDRGKIVEIKVDGIELVNENHIIFHKDKVQTKSFKTLIEIIKNHPR